MENVLVDRMPVRLRRPARLLRLASDERLVALVRAGDEGAFEALYDRHHRAILGFCRHMLGTREEAEDAVQHTFLAAFRDFARHEQPIDLRPWLFAVARNRCLSLLRARRSHVAIDEAEPATDGLAATIEQREDLRELLADLACLPEDQRAALLLAQLGALDHAGIAAVLGCPREKVKALVFQARTSLAASREARATPCDEIRVQLATASGAGLRRGPLRRHLHTCDGCRAFQAEVATQRKLLALALPVVPSMLLKASVLSGGGAPASSGGGAVAASATAAGTASGASGGTLGGVLGGFVTTGAGKVAVSLAVAGIVAGGGALTERLEQQAHSHPAAAAPTVPTAPPDVPPRQGAARALPASRTSAASAAPAQERAQSPTGRHSAGFPAAPAPSHSAPSARALVSPAPGAPHHTGPLPRTQEKAPNSVPPGHGSVPPGQANTPPGQAKAPPGHAGTPPRQAKTPPRQTSTSHGHAGTPPGQANTPPGQIKTPAGQANTPPGQANTPPGQASEPPADAAVPQAQPDASPGHSGAAPGPSGAPHGHPG